MNEPVAAKPGSPEPAALEQVVEAGQGEHHPHRHHRAGHRVADDADPVGDADERRLTEAPGVADDERRRDADWRR